MHRQGIARFIHQLGLTAATRKRKPRTTDRAHDHPIAPNLLNRQFSATAPNQRWVGDITVVDTQEGWLYVAALVDRYSRRWGGWAMSAHPNEALVTAAFQMAYRQCHPHGALLHHTDRGSHYTSLG
ncbi:MAG: DDE-type integrase/transposase/recombinase [Ktedonobacterales bacterium]|nr:DDE-type integrase/transposase/recombinase [Ktedonobacterales bacterium]